MPEMMIFALDQSAWVIDDFLSTGSDYDPSVARVIAEVPHSIVAASIVNHLVYASTDQAQLFVAPEDDLVEMEYVSQLPAVVVDMAYNPTTGKLYGVTVDNDLIEIDPILGETTAIGCVGSQPTPWLWTPTETSIAASLIQAMYSPSHWIAIVRPPSSTIPTFPTSLQTARSRRAWSGIPTMVSSIGMAPMSSPI